MIRIHTKKSNGLYDRSSRVSNCIEHPYPMSLQAYDTIIVGLGAAGATAASTLARAGRRVLALEAQDRVGGRVHTVPFGDGVVELGAEWLHGTHPNPVYDAAIQHNKAIVPQDLDHMVFQSDGVVPDEAFQDLFNELMEYAFAVMGNSVEESQPVGKYTTEKLIDYIKAEKPEVLKQKEFLDQLLDFMNQLANNYNASNDWDDIDQKNNFEEIKGHHHLSWHRYGYKTFFDILLNKDVGFPTLDIKLNTEVTQIEWPLDPKGKVKVTCKNGVLYTANNVVVTVSLGVLKERHAKLFKPLLPEKKVTAIETVAMGVMDKIDLAFDEVWWPLDAVFFGLLWKEEDRKKVAKQDYWTTRIFAASRPMGSRNVLTLWTSGEIAKLVETLPIDEVKRKCWQLLQRFMGAGKTVPKPIAVERSTWYSNPFTRGSYSFDSIQASHYPTARATLAAPLTDSTGRPRVLFAGEATHPTRFSTVDGASDTGRREAEKLLLASKL
ncbi:peroxisomal N(1)-acetyl-spermine/spermidine oxidase-like isoform X2 [Pectinophora gossypiella]|uniref:peroxisomal N(1)-acetyl-spermine/spermidine oxidase-like isoform X2 n=1 Tax=Pectinophora gossypiella TaxID=13191 RepID=UPI00214E9E0A|nr:peroxisomal N(1)-acetyl-spermine/spermidine oxidase-like isoform X2 [Pectinophora gossypiella]